MRRIPLYSEIGRYCFLVNDMNNLTEALKNKDLVDVIYTVGFSVEDAMCKEISTEEATQIEHPSKPIWLNSYDNFIALCNKDYFNIMPITTEVIPTFNCCFRCNQCAYRSIKENKNIWKSNNSSFNMSKNTMETILNQLAQGGVKNVVFTGGGEPLSNLDVTLFGMELCNRLNLRFGLYTNGVYLSNSVIKRILSYSPEFIRVSIYGTEEETFHNYTNASNYSFKVVIENVKNLLKETYKFGTETAISLSFLMHPILFPKVQSVWKLVDLFRINELKEFKSIRFTPAVNYDTKEQHPKPFFDGIVNEIKKIKEKYLLDNLMIYNHRLEDIYELKKYKDCLGNGLYAEVGPNGELYFCCERVGNADYIIGDLTKESILEVWTSERRKQLFFSISCKTCPNLCKPHEANKQMELISKNNLDIELMKKWFEEINTISSDVAFSPGFPNAFES